MGKVEKNKCVHLCTPEIRLIGPNVLWLPQLQMFSSCCLKGHVTHTPRLMLVAGHWLQQLQ